MSRGIKAGTRVLIEGKHSQQGRTGTVLADHGILVLVQVDGLTEPCRPNTYYRKPCGCEVPLIVNVSAEKLVPAEQPMTLEGTT